MKQRGKRFGRRAAWLCVFLLVAFIAHIFYLALYGVAKKNIFLLNSLAYAKNWKQADIPESSKVVFTPAQHIDQGEIELFPGEPMTDDVAAPPVAATASSSRPCAWRGMTSSAP